jgi:dihydroorotate dehydrogenase
LLFQFDAEKTHLATMKGLDVTLGPDIVRRRVRASYTVDASELQRELWGLQFPNPVGLAAGFDKNAEHVGPLCAFGFGFIEVGTVTGQPQEGNPKPRMFRLKEDRALLNRMGFNNHGSEVIAERLEDVDAPVPMGVNIGKSKVVPLEKADSDYEKSFRRLFDHGDYFVVNVSSPNTPGLRDLQKYKPLSRLLGHLQSLNTECAEERGAERRPLLVKFAPDLTEDELDAALRVVDERDIDGIIATNTTVERDGLETDGQQDLGPGGISGRPLTERSRQMIRTIYQKTGGEIPIIGVGGIFDADDALKAIRAGASMVQVWTGFIYEGPGMVRRINRGLLEACQKNGWDSIEDAVGLDA